MGKYVSQSYRAGTAHWRSPERLGQHCLVADTCCFKDCSVQHWVKNEMGGGEAGEMAKKKKKKEWGQGAKRRRVWMVE